MAVVTDAEAAEPTSQGRIATVFYPETESYTTTAICKAFEARLPHWTVCTSREQLQQLKSNDPDVAVDLQLCDYDEIDWDLAESSSVLTNAYMLRKALIRKSYLSSTVAQWLSKHPKSILSHAIPETYPFHIAHADELDELLCDELYEVARSFEANAASNVSADQRPWWILKPAMADKGQGIRIFDSIDALQAIMSEFEDSDNDDDEDEDEPEDDGGREAGRSRAKMNTTVRLSQMRDWVVQRYISRPLLLETPHLPISNRKFHLRVYTLVVGSLQAFVYTDILALFASENYSLPTQSDEDGSAINELSRHLTNTCLQDDAEAADSVHLLRDLVDCVISGSAEIFTEEKHDEIVLRTGLVIGEAVRAASAVPNHFSVAPNAFEIFGVDLMLSQPEDDRPIGVHLLEFNACPDFKQSGNDLHHVIERLFEGAIDLAVKPFFDPPPADEDWPVLARRGDWLKCLDLHDGQKPARAAA